MDIDFQTVQRNFQAFLEERQNHLKTSVDIRELVLSLRYAKLGIGFVEKNLTSLFARNLKDFLPNAIPFDNQEEWDGITTFFGSGCIFNEINSSHAGLLQIFSSFSQDNQLILLETASLASATCWQDGFATTDRRVACLGYVYDDIAHYYMAEYPNRLIQKLNSDEELSEDQRERALRCMAVMAENHLSKYNHQPYLDLVVTSDKKKRILVVDQSFADASLIYGRVTEQTFQDMLVAAIRENPDAEILVKTHPDSIGDPRKRPGYFSGLTGYGNVRFLVEPMNPMHLLEQVDKVYVATSGMGLEALIMGKPVVCFGHPYYAGWGLTDDRQPMQHRKRVRSLADVFYYFYIWYSIYHTPESNGPCEIEDTLRYILENRPPTAGRPSEAPAAVVPPKISVIIPAYNVEKYIEPCLRSLQDQTIRDIEMLVVDDCSQDSTMQIVDAMATRDPRIRILRMEQNSGQGFARNMALSQARGEYVWFTDSDDFIPSSDALERLYHVATRTDADMTRGRKLFEQHETLEGEFLNNVPDKTESYFEHEKTGLTFFTDPVLLNSRHFFLWLYRRSFLETNNIRFLTGQWEERPFLLKALLSAARISLVPCDALRYRIRPDSTARRDKNFQDVENQFMNFSQVLALFDEFSTSERSYDYHKRFTVSQYMHYIGFGFAMNLLVAKRAEPESQRLLRKLVELCRATGLRSNDLISDPLVVNNAMFAAGVYHLLFEALRRDDVDLALLARERTPLAPRDYYDRLMSEKEPGFVDALNDYVRGHPAPLDPQDVVTAPESSPRILLHIGTTKTGSTFLQAFMEANRAALLRQGIWYPEFGIFKQVGREYKQAGHSDLLHQANAGNAEFLTRLLRGLNELPYPVRTIVLSSEAYFLHTATPENLPIYLAGFPITMMVYLRRQDEWANSQYCEFVGGGAMGRVSLNPEEWLAASETKERMDYRYLLGRWERTIGKDNIIVRPYERSQLVQNDLLHDFLLHLDVSLNETFRMPDKKQHNDFFHSEEYIKFMRHFNNLAYASNIAYLDFVTAVNRELPCGSDRKPQMLTLEQRHWILQKAREGNNEVAERFLGKHGGPLFENTALPKDMPPPPRALGADFFSGMVELYNQHSGKKFMNRPAEKQDGNAGKAKNTKKPDNAIEQKKKFDNAYHQGCVAYYQRDYQKAVDYYRQADELIPDNVDLLRVMAEALIKAGNKEEARGCLEKAATFIPGNKALKRRLFWVKQPLLGIFLKNKPFPVPVPGIG